jgi:hypothetical protein
MVIMSFHVSENNIKMSPRSSTPCRDTTKARPSSGQSQGSLVVRQPSVMLRKVITTKLKVPIPKQYRGKEVPTVKVVEDGVLHKFVKKKTTKPEPSPPPQQSAKKVSSKRRASYHSSGKVEKPITPLFRVRKPKPARVRIQNSQQAAAMLHRMQTTGEDLTIVQDSLGCMCMMS